MMLWRLLGFSALHFALWVASALVAYGTDFDHLASRSPISQGAATLASVLQYPHDLFLHQFGSHWLERSPQVAGWLVVANSLLWGALLLRAWRLLFASRTTSGGAKSPLARG